MNNCLVKNHSILGSGSEFSHKGSEVLITTRAVYCHTTRLWSQQDKLGSNTGWSNVFASPDFAFDARQMKAGTTVSQVQSAHKH